MAAFEIDRLRVIVFDVDGTLYRQAPLRRAMLLRLLAAALRKPGSGLTTYRALKAYRRAQELLRDTAVEGPVAAEQLRLAAQHSGLSERTVAELVARWMEIEPLSLLERLVEPSLRAVLHSARDRGLRLGVLSDYPAAAKLEAMRLAQFFDVVVCAQDEGVNRFKPNPAGLLEALRRLGASREEALYIGDRRDIDAPVARAAGVRCIILDRAGAATKPEGWITVPGYDELHAILFPQSRPSRASE